MKTIISLPRERTVIMDRNSSALKKWDAPRAESWYRQGLQGNEMLPTNKHLECYCCLWSVDYLGAPLMGWIFTDYGCSPPGRLIPGHSWELDLLPALSNWKHKTTTKIKGSATVWASEMPKTIKSRGYFKEILKERMWGPALPCNQGPCWPPVF